MDPLDKLFSCRLHNSPSVPPLGELFSCQPFNSLSFGELFSCRPFNCPSVHPSGELFSCRPCNSPFVPPLWRVIFVPSLYWASYFCADHVTLHPSMPLASYFRAEYLALHPSIHLESYFCRLFKSPSLHRYGEYILLWIHFRFIWAPKVMYWVIVESEGNH